MVFSSYEFLFYFLPCAYVGFILAKRLGGWDFAFAYLGAASRRAGKHPHRCRAKHGPSVRSGSPSPTKCPC